MRHLTLPAALAVLCTLASCGKSEGSGAGAGSSGTAASVAAAASSPGPSPAAAPSPTATAAPAQGGGAGAPTQAASSATSGNSSSSSSATGPGATATASASSSGQTVFQQACVACHGAGVAGAPKLGDKAAWGPRVAQGKETLYTHAINGYQGRAGVMPPKGGNTALADADVKAAVDYMVSQAQ